MTESKLVAQARAEERERCAAWHEARAIEYDIEASDRVLSDGSFACRDSAWARSDAQDHRKYAAAIRALSDDPLASSQGACYSINEVLDELGISLVERVRKRLYSPVPLTPDDKRDLAHVLDLFMDKVKSLSGKEYRKRE